MSAATPAIARATAILGALATGDPMTASELAAHLDLQKSSVSDLCGSLLAEHFIRKDSDGSFTLGKRLEELASRLIPDARILDSFTNTVAEQVQLDGFALTLEVLRGAETLTVAARLGSQPLPLTPRPGTRTPALATAAGLAILVGTPRPLIEKVLSEFAAHQAIPAEKAEELAAHTRNERRDYQFLDERDTRQIAALIPATQAGPTFTAVSLHLPVYFPSEGVESLGEAVATYARRLSTDLA